MKKIYLFISILIPTICLAGENKTMSFEELKTLTGTSFDKIIESCDKNYKDQEICIKYRQCSSKEFKTIGEGYYYLLTANATQYIHNPKDAETEYCYGEPDEMQAIIYKGVSGEMTEIGSINSNQCFLSIDSKVQYKNSEILKANCRFTGTGSFFEETHYLITNKGIQLINYDRDKLKMPHSPLGYDSFTINNDSIDYSSVSHAKYCNCLESFSAQLDVKETPQGSLYFSYIESSYKPFFTSKSNSKNKKGLNLYHKKKYEQASKEFLSATELDVSNYEAFSNLGLSYLKLNKLEESIQILNYAYENATGQQKANAAYNIGLAYESKSDYKSAIKYYSASNSLKTTEARKKAIERVKQHLTSQGSNTPSAQD